MYNYPNNTYQEGWVLERDKNKPCIKSLGYYQWIPFVLLLQVIYPN